MAIAVMNNQASDTPSVSAFGGGFVRENFSAPYAGMPDFNNVLMSRIEKADKRIGVISVEECMNKARIGFHTKWEERHG